MFVDYYRAGWETYNDVTRHMVERVHGLETFLNDNAAYGESYEIRPASAPINGHYGLVVLHTDINGHTEPFPAMFAAKKIADGLFESALWFPDLDEGAVLGLGSEHYYADEAQKHLLEQLVNVRTMIAEELPIRAEWRKPRLHYHFDAVAREISPDGLHALDRAQDRWEQGKKPGVWSDLASAVFGSQPRRAPRFG